ncbi:hypothetical protein KEM52_000221 [Ascosphaera acerosa]|nr:hypothetical protein KEM52_000221 [Ascosphaera acerosa]
MRQAPPPRGTGLKDPARQDGAARSLAAAADASLPRPAHPQLPAPQQPESVLSTFPQSPSEFDKDDRISYSKLDSKWILEADDGTEYVWDDGLRRWGLSIDDELLEQQRQAYRVEGVDEAADTINAIKQKKRKRRQGGSADPDDEGTAKGDSAKDAPSAAGKRKKQQQKRQRVNTAVYISSLPPDTTEEELHSVFSRCGVIAEQIDNHRPRIKMYEDGMGQFKGDALVVYFRPESVQLAVQMLDDTALRIGDTQNPPMKVQPADLSYKVQKDDDAGDENGKKAAEGAKKGGNDAASKQDDWQKRKIQKKTQMLRSKLADWDDDDVQTIQTKQPSKWDKVVILKHMFTLQELEQDPAAILDIKEDIRDECSKLGDVTNVVLYDKEEEGIVLVRFASPEAAQHCLRSMNGRYFGGTQVEAYIPDREPRFRKSGQRKVDIDDLGEGWEAADAEDEEAARLEKFSSWLEREA